MDVIDGKDILYIVMEYAEGGELFDKIIEKKRFCEEEAKFYFYQMVSAVKHLHSLHIVHRDLKPENMLFCASSTDNKNNEKNVLKITDLGLSKETLDTQAK